MSFELPKFRINESRIIFKSPEKISENCQFEVQNF